MVKEACKVKKKIISSAVAFAVRVSCCLVLLFAPPSVEVVSASPAPGDNLFAHQETTTIAGAGYRTLKKNIAADDAGANFNVIKNPMTPNRKRGTDERGIQKETT